MAGDQGGRVHLDDSPYQVLTDLAVLVRKNMSVSDDRLPRDLGVRFLELSRHLSCRSANDLE
jgi:hypothetical protein